LSYKFKRKFEMCKFISLILLMWNWKVATLYLITSPCPAAHLNGCFTGIKEERGFLMGELKWERGGWRVATNQLAGRCY
jgi:hypothetical protein